LRTNKLQLFNILLNGLKCNLKAHECVQGEQPPVSTPNLLNPAKYYTVIINIHFNITLPSMLSSLKCSLSSQIYIFTLFLFFIHEIPPTFVIVNNISSYLVTFLILGLGFRRVVNVIHFLLGKSPASVCC
jgi:hypothetical protein